VPDPASTLDVEDLDIQPLPMPRFTARWKSPVSKEAVTEIRKPREGGMALLTIAQRFGISESAVSRICAGNKHGQ
jgi:hypothetical protein